MMKQNKRNEQLKPFANKIGFIRLCADMQVCSTYKTIKKYLKEMEISKKKDGNVLDVGCGSQPYKFLFEKPNMKNINYQGIDWEGAEEGFDYRMENVIYYDGKSFPCEDEKFDLVFHTEVAEHVPDLPFFFKECYRVTKKGGGNSCFQFLLQRGSTIFRMITNV